MPTIKYPTNPNTDTAFIEQEDGTKNRALMTAPQDISTLELPNNPNSTKGYITVDGKKQRVILTADITGGGGGGGSSLPDQTGHSGEFLTTDGTDASWSAVNALPDQTGHSGEFLTTDGSSASWDAISALQNTATGTDALTILGTATSQQNSVNIGVSSYAYEKRATSVGSYARTSGDSASAFGASSDARNYRSTALGSQCVTAANYSLAIGWNASTSAVGSIQIGSNPNMPYNWDNSDANTFKVGNANGNYEIMSADGTIPEARLADTTNAAQGQVLALDSNLDAVWTTPSGGGLPSQTGNAGKFLTTDGTDASWSDKPLVNTATGTNSLTILGTATTADNAINIGRGSAVSGSVTGAYGIAIGDNAKVNGGNVANAIAIGRDSKAGYNNAIAIGNGAKATSSSGNSVVIGSESGALNGSNNYKSYLCFGPYAHVSASYAIQLNASDSSLTNSEQGTMCVGLRHNNTAVNYKLLDSDGTIPADRLASTTGLADGNYRLRLTMTSGVPTLSWVAE